MTSSQVCLTLCSISLALSSCATTGPTAGSYATGSDSRYVAEARSQNVLTESQYQQHKRQRRDVAEEMDLDEKKRRASLGGLRTAAEGASLVRSIIGGRLF